MYDRALQGIRATQRGEVPVKPRDPFLPRDVSTILADCAIRPEESFRLRWESVQGDIIEITHGKTKNARRRVPRRSRRFDSEFAAGGVPGRLGLSRADEEWPDRTVDGPGAACESLHAREGEPLPAMHFPSHLPDTLGAAYGPLDAGVSRRPQQHGHHEAVRSSAAGEHAAGDCTRAKRTGWAQFWAHFERRGSFQSSKSGRNSLTCWGLVVGGESLELPTFWV
jgi:hypothetical protein